MLGFEARKLTYVLITKEEYDQGYRNLLKAQTTTYNQSLTLEIFNRTVWTIKKAHLSKMRVENNEIISEKNPYKRVK